MAAEFSERMLQFLEWGDLIAIERPGPAIGLLLFYSLRRTQDHEAVRKALMERKPPPPAWNGYKLERFVVKESLVDTWLTWDDCEHSEWKYVATLEEAYQVIAEWGVWPSMFVHARDVRYPF